MAFEDNPRVIVKFRDSIELPYDDHVEERLDELHVGQWRKLKERFPGISMRRLYRSVEPNQMQQFVREAKQRNDSYRPPNFLTYFVVYCPPMTVVEDLVNALRGWHSVQTSYFDPPGNDPTVNAGDDLRSPDQGYLDAAPAGIDARYAWSCKDGDGAFQHVIDLEKGWTLNHEDLVAHGAQLLHGLLLDECRPHGTSVLGVICAVDNQIGCVGIAPNVGSVNVVSYHGSTRSDAIVAASKHLPYGGVLLLQAQLPNITIAGNQWAALPIEALDDEYETIRLVTTRGITVVEAAGNGACDLDTFTDGLGKSVLKRGDAAFRDSGAIMVGAATSEPPHSPTPVSNRGSRIDCYAWGEHVVTCTSSAIAPFAISGDTSDFRDTSAAAAIVTGAVLLAQGIAQKRLGYRLGALQMRGLLGNQANGTASQYPGVDRIGVMPDLRKLIKSNALGLPNP